MQLLTLRKDAVKWLRTHRDAPLPNGSSISQYCYDQSFDTYCEDMLSGRLWGDYLTLYALAHLLDVKIIVISRYSMFQIHFCNY